MIRWISKSGTFMQSVIFIVLMAMLWAPAFLNPQHLVQTPHDGPLYTFIAKGLMNSPLLSVAVALLLVVLESLLIFFVYRLNGFFGRGNMLPAIIMLLAFSWSGSFQTMHAVLPATLFLILSLHAIMNLYGQQAAYQQLFVAAFSSAIAALLYLPLSYMILMLYFTMITYRVSAWREYVVIGIGFLLPFVYYVAWLFWNDSLQLGLQHLADAIMHIERPSRITAVNTIWLAVSGFVMFICLLAVLSNLNDKLISIRRRSWVLFNFALAALIALLLNGWPILSANYIFIIPLSFFISGSFTFIKRPFWIEMFAIAYLLFFTGMKLYLAMLA